MFWEAQSRLMGATPFIWRQSRYNKEITFDMTRYLCKKNYRWKEFKLYLCPGIIWHHWSHVRVLKKRVFFWLQIHLNPIRSNPTCSDIAHCKKKGEKKTNDEIIFRDVTFQLLIITQPQLDQQTSSCRCSSTSSSSQSWQKCFWSGLVYLPSIWVSPFTAHCTTRKRTTAEKTQPHNKRKGITINRTTTKNNSKNK